MSHDKDLPAPLVPPDVDLRGYEFMPYYGDRLRDSDLNSRASDAEYRAAHNLWWSAWKQVPAASVPDDDTVLARLADLGRDVKTWQRVRDVALRGFVKCSDGRFYHQVLAPLAIEAFKFRNLQRTRTKAARDAKLLLKQSQEQSQSLSQDKKPPVTAKKEPDKPPVTDSTGQDRIGQDIKSKSSATPAGKLSPHVQVATWLRAQGLTGGNADNPKVVALAEEGVTEQEIIEAVRIARIDRGKGEKPFHFAYVLGILTDIRNPPERQNSANWRATDALIVAKAMEIGVSTVGRQRDEIIRAIDQKLAEVSRGTGKHEATA